jgi:hypothetical protein
MKYFGSLPLIRNTDKFGNVNLLTNILIRTQLIPKLANNPLVYYSYPVQEGDTPESIANKYYGDSYRYWITLYGNPQIIDPQGDWPMTSNQFLLYLQDKYAVAANGASNVVSYAQATPYEYQKVVTTVDSTTQTTVVKTVVIDSNTYNTLIASTNKQTFADGSYVTYTTSKNILSIYDYELQQNEAKRNINLINSNYATDIEMQYKTLVST